MSFVLSVMDHSPFYEIDVVLPINNVSEAINHVLPIYAVPAARTETDVLGPKKGG